jgi:hypothetical protein
MSIEAKNFKELAIVIASTIFSVAAKSFSVF